MTPQEFTKIHQTFNRYVVKIVASRLHLREDREDACQAVWIAIFATELPADPDQCRKLVATIAHRSAIRFIRQQVGRTGRKIVAESLREDAILPSYDRELDTDYLSPLPAEVHYLATALVDGHSATSLYPAHGQYTVRRDFQIIQNLLG